MISDIIPAIMGVCFIIGGLIKMKDNRYLKVYGIKVKGIVYALEREGDHYHPVVRFRIKKEEWITKKLDSGTNPSLFSEGDPVNLLYDPEDPEVVQLDSFPWLIIFPGLFIFAGSGFIGYYLLALFEII